MYTLKSQNNINDFERIIGSKFDFHKKNCTQLACLTSL